MTAGALKHGSDSRPRARPLIGRALNGQVNALTARLGVATRIRSQGVAVRLHTLDDQLAAGLPETATSAGVADHVVVHGRASNSNLVFATLDTDGNPACVAPSGPAGLGTAGGCVRSHGA